MQVTGFGNPDIWFGFINNKILSKKHEIVILFYSSQLSLLLLLSSHSQRFLLDIVLKSTNSSIYWFQARLPLSSDMKASKWKIS